MASTQSVLAAAERYDIDSTAQLDEAGNPRMAEDDEEQLSCSCDGVSFYLGDLAAGPGKLFITTRRVIWCSQSTPPTPLSLTYHQIVMHAVSKDSSAFPRPCIYLQIDDGSEDMAEDDDQQDDELAGASPEIRLVPEDSQKVEELFKALCDCAALNPDPENEDEGDFYFDEDEVMAGLDDETRAALMAQRIEGGALNLQAGEELEELVGEDPSRFEDDEDLAYEEEEEDSDVNAAEQQAPKANGQHTH